MQNKIEIINKEKKVFQENIKKITSQRDSINSEYRRSIDIIKKYKESKKYEDNLKLMEKIEGLEEDLENAYKTIDILAKNKYDSKHFDIYDNHKDTGNRYDSNGFDRDGYNINGLDKDGLDRDGNNINGIKGTRKKYPKRKINYSEYDDDTLYDQYGFNSQEFNKDGYDIYGFDKDGLNKDGYDMYGFKKNQVKLKLAKQNLLKIKKEKDTLFYLFFCLKYILIIIQSN